MKQHVADCRICLTDPGVRQEVEKITEIVLPPSKVRLPVSKAEAEMAEEAEEIVADDYEPEEAEAGEEQDEEEEEEEEEDLDEDEEDGF